MKPGPRLAKSETELHCCKDSQLDESQRLLPVGQTVSNATRSTHLCQRQIEVAAYSVCNARPGGGGDCRCRHLSLSQPKAPLSKSSLTTTRLDVKTA